jgi:hypothetical protein
MQIDPNRSVIQIITYRGGRLARLGHNHVIAAREIAGTVWVRPQLQDSSLELRISVEKLTVDEPQLRVGRGAEFPAEVPQNARDGTRQNMLSAGLLNREKFPQIFVRSAGIQGTASAATFALEVEFKGQRYNLQVPAEIRFDSGQVSAQGRTTLLQSSLGLTPFSVMLGALQVKDQLDIEYDILAAEASAPPQ